MHKSIGLAFLLLSTLVWTRGSDTPEAAVRILFTGDVQGTFEPCGCAGGPAGGLARRAGYAAGVAESWNGPLLQLDAGNYFENPGPSAEAVNRLLVESLERIPIIAMNLGVDDLYWWPDFARNESVRSRLISTNLQPRSADLPVPERFLVTEVPLSGVKGNRIRIGFVGLVDPSLVKPNSGFRALDPIESVRSVVPQLREEADLVVLLWDTIRPSGKLPPDSPIVKLAGSVDGIDLIITTEKRFVRYAPLRIDATILLSSIERGRFLGDLVISFDPSGGVKEIRPDFVEMKEGVREDPHFRAEQDGVAAGLPR